MLAMRGSYSMIWWARMFKLSVLPFNDRRDITGKFSLIVTAQLKHGRLFDQFFLNIKSRHLRHLWPVFNLTSVLLAPLNSSQCSNSI